MADRRFWVVYFCEMNSVADVNYHDGDNEDDGMDFFQNGVKDLSVVFHFYYNK